MSAFTNFAGARIVSGRITMPLYGAWVADIVIADATPIPTTGTLAFGSLSLTGTVVRSLAYSGLQNARLVGGYGGWRRTIPSRAYQFAAGVLLSTVLGDAAKECGESVTVTTDASIGTAYVREQAPASRTLRGLAGALWWIDPTGTTRVGPRDGANAAVSSQYEVINANGGDGAYSIATDAPGDWFPGVSFTSPAVPVAKVVQFVTHTVTDSGKGRVEVLAA